MIPFLAAVPQLILYGCLALVAATTVMAFLLKQQVFKVRSRIAKLATSLRSGDELDRSERHHGLQLQKLEELRARCSELDTTPRQWWEHIDQNTECYTSPDERDGWFLTDKARNILSFEAIVGRHFHSALFSSFPGLLTGSGLALTFVAILLALHGVQYNEANASNPVSGIGGLINGLSGKFLSSIVALILSILFTLYEKRVVRGVRLKYEQLIAALSNAIPYLSASRILLDIQRFARQQKDSLSNISSEVVDRFVAAFNERVVPDLAAGMSSGVAEKMQSEFRPTMERMSSTLENLQTAIVGLETQKQESVTGEIRGLLESLQTSLVQALSKMGADFHDALTGAASREFGNVQGTLEATRQMLSDMNSQFGNMQAAFAAIIEKAEETTSDQLKSGKEQTEALTALMNGLMVSLQQTADQNLTSVRTQLTLVVSDLSEKVGTLSRDMMAAAENVAKQSQASASHVLEQTGNWSEATAKRLEALLTNIEARSTDFQAASQGLLQARSFLTDLIGQNATALDRMAEASRQVQAYSSGLAGQTDALKTISNSHSAIANQLREVSGSVRASFEQHEKMLGEYRRVFSDYKAVIDELDVNLGKILAALHSGLRDYNQSIENNFREVVNISNQMVPEISSLLKTQVDELSEQFDELGSVISNAMERVNGRVK
jgi:ABC-type transporter Mla subunit MlaD